VLLAELVETSRQVAATPARSTKTALLAGLFERLDPDELAIAVSWLSGEPRQGRIGVGWSTVSNLDRGRADASSLTIGEVDAALDEVQRLTGPGSVAARSAVLGAVVGRATAAESDFLGDLLTGGIRQGALQGVVLDAVAKATHVRAAVLRRAAMLAGDVSAVAVIARARGEEGLAEVGLTPLRPVLPMLAASSTDVADALATTGLASVEWKLDGARIQVHRDGDEVAVFTRNLNDITVRLPNIVAIARSLPARCFVLDGEALFVDEEERPDRFQDTMSRFSRQSGDAGGLLAGRFFDCIHLDGSDLLDLPLADRIDALDSFARDWRIPSVVTDDPEVAATFLDAALAAGHEGVMVKALDSRYEAGRRGGAWRKVKPVTTLDLVVLAAEWGHGRRKGWLSNLHLGARDPEGGFVMVGKTFKGLTDALLTWQTEQFLAREVEREGITVRVRPELVVEIALDGVQRSTRYPGGVALRFARVKRYRDDKSPADADTIDTVRKLL
jgi:DNA ligase 1